MASELADMLRRRAAILLQRRAIGDHEDGRRMNNAADALDARDRDVAELVGALREIVADFDARVLVLNAAIAADGPPVTSIAAARSMLAKHKGGA